MDVTAFAKYKHSQLRDRLLHSLLNGKCCALLGFPGSGKTVMTADIVRTLIEKHGKRVAITGSTGMAAQQLKTLLADIDAVKAQTIHSFLGYRSHELDTIEKGDLALLEKMTKSSRRQGRFEGGLIRFCDVLIVEEVSLLTPEFIEAMDMTLKIARERRKRFGDVTVLFVGDFRQLPPVSRSAYGYCFKHPSWHGRVWVDKVYALQFILRQSGDMLFTDIILRLSHNAMSDKDERLLAKRVVPNGRRDIMDVDFLPQAVRVFHTNREVNCFNKNITERAIECGKEKMSIDVKWEVPKGGGDWDGVMKRLRKDMVFSADIFVGAQVIITANMSVECGIVNGTMAEVVSFHSVSVDDQCDFGSAKMKMAVCLKLDGSEKKVLLGCNTLYHSTSKYEKICGHYMPLLLCHALTVHRLQGSTIRKPLFFAPRKTGSFFQEFYVIATRLTSLDLLYLTHLPSNMQCIVDPQVLDFYEDLIKKEVMDTDTS